MSCVIGPNGSRTMKDTGRTWTRGKRSGPVMVDGNGHEFNVTRTSAGDLRSNLLSNGFLERVTEDLPEAE